jgi:hypothetical protein
MELLLTSQVYKERKWEPLSLLVCPRFTWSDRVLYRISSKTFARLIDHPDERGSTYLWNVCLLWRNYTAIYPTRLWNLKSHITILNHQQYLFKCQRALCVCVCVCVYIYIYIFIYIHISPSATEFRSLPVPTSRLGDLILRLIGGRLLSLSLLSICLSNLSNLPIYLSKHTWQQMQDTDHHPVTIDNYSYDSDIECSLNFIKVQRTII